MLRGTAKAIEKEHNVYVDIGSNAYNRESWDAEYGWLPIPESWVSEYEEKPDSEVDYDIIEIIESLKDSENDHHKDEEENVWFWLQCAREDGLEFTIKRFRDALKSAYVQYELIPEGKEK